MRARIPGNVSIGRWLHWNAPNLQTTCLWCQGGCFSRCHWEQSIALGKGLDSNFATVLGLLPANQLRNCFSSLVTTQIYRVHRAIGMRKSFHSAQTSINGVRCFQSFAMSAAFGRPPVPSFITLNKKLSFTEPVSSSKHVAAIDISAFRSFVKFQRMLYLVGITPSRLAFRNNQGWVHLEITKMSSFSGKSNN